MFRIGEFSRLAHVSTRLLRHYDELGLLQPADVDRRTGYRFYRAAQLGDLNRILVLRDLGFSLAQIGTVLQQSPDVQRLRGMLEERRSAVAREVALQQRRLDELQRRLDDLEQGPGDGAEDDVVIRPLPAASYLSLRAQLTGFEQATALVARMLQTIPAQVGRGRLGQLLVVQRADEFEPDALDLQLGFVLERPLPRGTVPEVDGSPLGVTELSPVEEAAVCVRVGPPAEVHTRAGALARAVEARGYRLHGENRELFLQAPRPDTTPVIEMQFPVRKR